MFHSIVARLLQCQIQSDFFKINIVLIPVFKIIRKVTQLGSVHCIVKAYSRSAVKIVAVSVNETLSPDRVTNVRQKKFNSTWRCDHDQHDGSANRNRGDDHMIFMRAVAKLWRFIFLFGVFKVNILCEIIIEKKPTCVPSFATSPSYFQLRLQYDLFLTLTQLLKKSFSPIIIAT